MRDKIDFKKIMSQHTTNCIINLDSSTGPGTHWVGLKKVGLNLLYLDSAGGRPTQEIVDAPEFKTLSRFALSGRIQGKSTTCGFYALLFLKFVESREDLIDLNLTFSSLTGYRSPLGTVIDSDQNLKQNEKILQSMVERVLLNPNAVRGSGPLTNWLLSLPLPELHLPLRNAKTGKIQKASFCGPYTKMDKRMNKDGTPKQWSLPVNELDTACMHHDIEYTKKDKSGRPRSDKELVEAAKEFRKKSTHLYDKGSAFAVEKVIGNL